MSDALLRILARSTAALLITPYVSERELPIR
jgi:hypothetical protein